VTRLVNGTRYRFEVRARNAAGWGPWTAKSATVTPRTVPRPPRDVRGTPRDRAARVTWIAPSSNSGAPITRYQVKASPSGRTCATTGARACTVTRLVNGTRYRFEVRARNAAGWGPWSARSAAVVPRR
jgi:chitodextrinase